MTNAIRLSALVLLSVLVPLAAPRPGGVRADGELQVSVRNMDVSKAPVLQFLAKVVDQNGKPVPGLGANAFSLKAGDKDIRITSVQSVIDAQVGISSLIVLDTSGSMVGAPINDARQAAAQYIQQLQPVDEVAVVAFADGIQTLANYSGDVARAQASLGGLAARGNTALYEAVAASARSIAERPAARRVVIFMSDGENFGPSPVTRDQALAAATGAGVPFYVIGLGPSIDRQFLQEVADASGGTLFIAPTSAQLTGLFSQISELLRSEYVLSADVSGTGLAGETRATFAVRTGAGSGETPVNLSLPSLPPPVAPVEPPAAEGGGSNLLTWLLLLFFVAAVAAGGGWLYKRRLEERAASAYTPPPVAASRLEVPDLSGGVPREAPPAFLRLEASGEELPVAGMVTLGVDPECTFRLPISAAEFGHGQLRIWFANQRYLIHDVSPRPRLKVNGRQVSWSILGDGDEIEVRGVRMRFATAPARA